MAAADSIAPVEIDAPKTAIQLAREYADLCVRQHEYERRIDARLNRLEIRLQSLDDRLLTVELSVVRIESTLKLVLDSLHTAKAAG